MVSNKMLTKGGPGPPPPQQNVNEGGGGGGGEQNVHQGAEAFACFSIYLCLARKTLLPNEFS